MLGTQSPGTKKREGGGGANATGQRRHSVRCGTWPSRRGWRRGARHLRRASAIRPSSKITRTPCPPLPSSAPTRGTPLPTTPHSPLLSHPFSLTPGANFLSPSTPPQSPLGEPKTKPARARRCCPTECCVTRLCILSFEERATRARARALSLSL